MPTGQKLSRLKRSCTTSRGGEVQALSSTANSTTLFPGRSRLTGMAMGFLGLDQPNGSG